MTAIFGMRETNVNVSESKKPWLNSEVKKAILLLICQFVELGTYQKEVEFGF